MFFMNGKLENEFQTKFFLRLQFEKSTLEHKSKISHLLNQHRETLGDTLYIIHKFLSFCTPSSYKL
jgi:hypothetical protein